MARSSKSTKRGVKPKGIKSGLEMKPTGGYFEHPPTFSFQKYDAGKPWATTSDRKPIVDDLFKDLHGFSGLKWAEIVQASGGRCHGTNNHYISILDLSPEAKRRANDLNIEEDELFSLRLQGDVRLWGTIEPNGCFFVVWYDPNHKVYPVTR